MMKEVNSEAENALVGDFSPIAYFPQESCTFVVILWSAEENDNTW